MKILSLFLALFMTLLPGSVSSPCWSQGQDSGWEEVIDVEEEAVIRTPQAIQKQIPVRAETLRKTGFSRPFPTLSPIPVHSCFERQWLAFRRLRL